MTTPRILIADDDDELVEMLARRCRSLGIDVSTAYSGLEALNLVEEQRPDVVCVDVHMPAGNGLGICEMMASDQQWSDTPVIVLTASEDHDTIRRCHQACAYYVLKGHETWPRLEPLLTELLGDRLPPGA